MYNDFIRLLEKKVLIEENYSNDLASLANSFEKIQING